MLVAQKQADVDDPKADDLYRIGTVATILQLLKLPDGTVKVLVEGVDRARIEKLHAGEHYSSDVTLLPDQEAYDEREMDVLARSVISQFEQYVKLNKKVPPEVLTALAGIEHAGRLADTVAAHMSLKLAEKQKVLEILDVRKRLEHILVAIEGEMDVLQIEKRIRGRVKAQMEKSQREYYLNEQMKAIQKELGEMDEGGNEITELEQKIAKAGMPKEAREKPPSCATTSTGWSRCRGRSGPRSSRTSPAPRRCWTKTTSGWTRSKSGSSSTSLSNSGWISCAVPSCVSWGRRVLERPRWARALRALPIASSCACHWAGCVTRPKFAAIGART
jgi:Lon protease-like protein